MRAHGQTSFRNPWDYSTSSETLFQKYYWTRENIVNLVNSGQIKANVENHPMTQSMVVAYPEQKKLAANGNQYLFCDSLLVCPVTESGVSVLTVQFPEGRWVNIWDGTVYEGDTQQTVDASLDTIPVYMEAGSVVPMTLGKTLKIGETTTENQNTEALVITPAVTKKENRIYSEQSVAKNYTSDALGDNTYSVSAEEVCDNNIVVAMGITAESVKVGNTELKELSKRPTSSSTEAGFYRDLEQNATLIVTGGNWTTIEYAGTSERYVNIALGAEVTTEELKDKNAEDAQNVTDGDYTTSLVVTEGKKASVVIDMKDSYQLSKILVKWGSSYARGYKMEISDSLEKDAKWTTVYEKKKGGGGTDTVMLEETMKCRYIRLTDFDILSKTGAQLSEVEAYGDVVERVDVKTGTASVTEQVQVENRIPDTIWYVVGGISALILVSCGVTACIISKKKRNIKED